MTGQERANLAAWWREQDRRIAAHAAVRATCRACRGGPGGAYGCDACDLAIAHIGYAYRRGQRGAPPVPTEEGTDP